MRAILSTRNHAILIEGSTLNDIAIQFAYLTDAPQHIHTIEQLADYLTAEYDYLSIMIAHGLIEPRKIT